MTVCIHTGSQMYLRARPDVYPRRRDTRALRAYTRARERARDECRVHLSEQTSEHREEKVSHMGASVPCNTSPTDGGDIRAADVQMKLTD